MNRSSQVERTEFGDFQTPPDLAMQCCRLVRDQLGRFETVVEPTCGEGAFIAATLQVLAPASVCGYEIHRPHICKARQRIHPLGGTRTKISCRDFFTINWQRVRHRLDGPVLFLGNPPWVTNSQLGMIDSANTPSKSNVDQLRGIDALTGRSNFDIAESVLRTLLEVMRPDCDGLAMLVKKSTARSLLGSAWKRGICFNYAATHDVDARVSFGVNVDACLMLLRPSTRSNVGPQVCLRSCDLESAARESAFGWFDRCLVANPSEARATSYLRGEDNKSWRSGVKHDLADVLELTEQQGALRTRQGDCVDIEFDRVYPLAKGSDVAKQQTSCGRRLLIPQRTMNEATEHLQDLLPKTFRYLRSHSDAFGARKSSIYRKRDPFAVFGIGDYTFAPWKVAICGMYKRLTFTLYGPIDGRPVVFDDTTYALSFNSESKARRAIRLLQSDIATRYFQARIFWDAKRPITANLLRSLDLDRVEQSPSRFQ